MGHAQHVARDDAYVKNGPGGVFRDANRLIVGDFGKYTSFIRLDRSTLPTEVAGKDIRKATLRLFVREVRCGGTFEVSRVHGDWNEATLSFETAAGIVGNSEGTSRSALFRSTLAAPG